MSQSDFKTFDSLAFCWESTQMMWFILVEEDGFPLLHFRAGRNEESEWKFQSMTTIEGKSRLMGETSHKARFNITDVICAPSIKCIVAAHNFIKGFERDQKEEMKILNIKVDGGLSESIEGYYLQKPFRSLAAERGYPVDEVYETSVTWSESCKVDPTFDSWSFRWESAQELWVILVEEDELPFLRLRSGVNQASVGKFPFTTMTERSRAMGRASFNARFNITNVICAPSFTCFTAADNFIKGFQDGLEDEMKILNIKVDGGLSSTVEGYYLHKQFRSMVVESGFNVDETYETSVKCPENYKIDPYVNLDWRINAALGSFKKKYSGSRFQMVAVFVDKCLDNVLKGATVGSWPAFKVHVPSVGISPFILEKFEE
ncbi:hypothetical protein T11_6862 [Trichinella zimbabwensis]|uniref:Uncharacterized protein n=1 Tax=Trichinella zimbabwensis TaxID=268475 RepID=A0A0V1H3N3_9BILA|nr:hypothetical protein T11_6862 [Trichinella zimbabwensis]